ncbi:MAG TPA: protoglobin domain-containing protein, partial [Methylocella sp.]|nr:protoglobin domain-containing protein [Methylocella sp.]
MTGTATSLQAPIAIGERLAFMGIDDNTRAQLRKLKPLVDMAIGGALDAFYSKVQAEPHTRKFFSDGQHMEAAKARQRKHWSVITESEFNEAYVNAVRGVGKAHARLGLEPRWYIGG